MPLDIPQRKCQGSAGFYLHLDSSVKYESESFPVSESEKFLIVQTLIATYSGLGFVSVGADI